MLTLESMVSLKCLYPKRCDVLQIKAGTQMQKLVVLLFFFWFHSANSDDQLVIRVIGV